MMRRYIYIHKDTRAATCTIECCRANDSAVTLYAAARYMPYKQQSDVNDVLSMFS